MPEHYAPNRLTLKIPSICELKRTSSKRSPARQRSFRCRTGVAVAFRPVDDLLSDSPLSLFFNKQSSQVAPLSYRTSSITASWSGDLNRLSRPVRQDGPGERRDVDRSAGGIGLIFAHDPEALFAAVSPAQGDCHAEGRLTFDRLELDDFCVRAPRWHGSRVMSAMAIEQPCRVCSELLDCSVFYWRATRRTRIVVRLRELT